MACQPHPTEPEVRCTITADNHPECTGWSPSIGNYVDWPNPDHVPSRAIRGKPTSKLREMAGRVASAPRVTDGFQAGLEGSQRAATRWTDMQKDLVDRAIRAVAVAHAGGAEFTADEVWDQLDGAVPVTKGLTARLIRAEHRHLILNTGKTEISHRGGHHDHGQRLAIWCSLVEKVR